MTVKDENVNHKTVIIWIINVSKLNYCQLLALQSIKIILIKLNLV